MKKSEIAAADGLLGDSDVKVTLDVPMGSAAAVAFCAVVIIASYFLMAKYLSR